MGTTSLLEIPGDSDSAGATIIRNSITGSGISYAWQYNGHERKAEIYGVDAAAVMAAFERFAKTGKTGFALVEAIFGAQIGNITCVALSNAMGYSDAPDGTAAIRHFYPGSGKMFLAEHWQYGEYLCGIRAEESNQNIPHEEQDLVSA